MLESLRFVKGAISKKDHLPELAHFHIADGRILGFNGAMGLSAPVPLDLEANPKALPFFKAIETCKDTVQLHMTSSGRLAVKSGSFKAYIDCVDSSMSTEIIPQGDVATSTGRLLPALETLSPFISEDASRPWSKGVLFKETKAYATNNIVLIEYDLGYKVPFEITVPHKAVRELLRIKEEPHSIQTDGSSVTFHFEGDKWLRTQVYAQPWPDLEPILNRGVAHTAVPSGLYQTVEELLPFTDDLTMLYMEPGVVRTEIHTGIGAEIEVNVQSTGAFQGKQLAALNGVATHIDFETYPDPCPFAGPGIRGVIMGARK